MARLFQSSCCALGGPLCLLTPGAEARTHEAVGRNYSCLSLSVPAARDSALGTKQR